MDMALSKTKIKNKVLFVTVGTTKFDELIAALDRATVYHNLVTMGVRTIQLQIGRGRALPHLHYRISKLMEDDCFDGGCPELPSKESCGNPDSQIEVKYYRYRDRYVEDFHNADLVMSHAGAGSIIEALNAKKPLIVVANSSLMDNHQLELSDEMSRLGYLAATSCGRLEEALHLNRLEKLTSPPDRDYGAFPKMVDDLMASES